MQTPSWKFPMAYGAALTLFGLGALIAPPAAAATLVFLIAALFLAGGVTQFVRIVRDPARRRFRLSTAVATLAIVTGTLMLAFPVAAVVGLTTLVLGFLLISGALKLLASALMVGVPGRAGTLLSGLVSIALALIVLATLPASAVTLLGVMIGVDVLFTGSALFGLGWAMRRDELDHPHRLRFHSRLSVA